MVSHEYIPLPSEQAQRTRPIRVEVSDLDAWPGYIFTVFMDWNSAMGQWTWEVSMRNYGTIIPRQAAQLLRPYRFGTQLYFMFADKADRTREITPRNLGEEVKLYVIPGPDSPAFTDWAQRMELSSTEIAQIREQTTTQPLS